MVTKLVERTRDISMQQDDKLEKDKIVHNNAKIIIRIKILR